MKTGKNVGNHRAAATFLAAAGRRFRAKVVHQQIYPQGVVHFSIVDVEIQQETAVVAHFTGVRVQLEKTFGSVDDVDDDGRLGSCASSSTIMTCSCSMMLRSNRTSS